MKNSQRQRRRRNGNETVFIGLFNIILKIEIHILVKI
jgi:hypothetical protein